MELNHTNLREIFEPLSTKVSEKLSDRKVKRDDLNMAGRVHRDKRNEINRQVKELIHEVQGQKSIRNEANAKVKELKKVRLDRSNELKELREILRSGNNRQTVEGSENRKPKGRSARIIRTARESLEKKYEKGGFPGNKEKDFHNMMKKLQKELKEATDREEASNSHALMKVRAAEILQTEAHKSVEKAVNSAQDAHDLMIELSEEVDRLRELANSEHGILTSTKREADHLHNQYIVSLRCIHSMQDIMKLSESRQKMHDEDGKVQISDLMSRLMSGDTLSTEELMLLQRN
ncbi:MAG: hypothetical protein VX571_03550 [Candidatus Thermoplasmatota archaeon]|nr:hypothetical protein [Candidatus Thermoplasmatota archaeon]